LFSEWSVLLVVEPAGDGAPLAVGEADVDRGKQPASVLPHVRREAGSDALLGNEVVGGANRGLVVLLARLAYQNCKDAAMEVNKRVGVAGEG
jgi:hypothetical protein